MKRKFIGIVPQIKKSMNDNPYENNYSYISNYIDRIKENNAIPIGLFGEDKVDNFLLDICDGFLLPGGRKIIRLHFEIIDYAIKNNKPVLGICLGMQAMAVYSHLVKCLKDKNIDCNIDNIWKLYVNMKKEEFMFLNPIAVPNIHGYQIMKEKIQINKDNIMKQLHPIKINNNSVLKDIYKSDLINVVSLHSYSINYYGDILIPSAYSLDGIIEALEYINKDKFILGVQYHPELNKDDILFKYFMMKVKEKSKVS